MEEQHQYDRALKSLFGKEAAEILPNLLPEAEFINEQNIEIDRTTLKADLVYIILYKEKLHVLNMELQTDTDNDMAIRMLKYHVGLYDKHRKPVISMIMYPFETSIPKSPFREMSGDEALLTLHYKVLPLWKLDAHQFIRDHVVCMYTLLPAMKGANAPMLLRAIEEMKQRYTAPDLGHHLVRFRAILRRSKALSEKDKQIVEVHMHSYDSLLDQDPYFQEQKALERAFGITLGRTEAITEAIQAFQNTVVEIVKNRFPTLLDLAQHRVMQIHEINALQHLVVQLSTAPNQATAQRILQSAFAD